MAADPEVRRMGGVPRREFRERVLHAVDGHGLTEVGGVADEQLVREAHAVLASQSSADRACALLVEGMRLVRQGRLAEAITSMEEGVEHARLHGDDDVRQALMRHLGRVVGRTEDAGVVRRACGVLDRGQAPSDSLELRLEVLVALATAADGSADGQARGRLAEAIEEARRGHPPWVRISACLALAQLELDASDAPRALSLLDDARAGLAARPDRRRIVQLEYLTGVTLHGLGRSDEALEHLFVSADVTIDPVTAVDVALARADALAALGSTEPARLVLEEALTVAAEADLVARRCRVAMRLAGLHASRGAWQEAYRYQSEASAQRERWWHGRASAGRVQDGVVPWEEGLGPQLRHRLQDQTLLAEVSERVGQAEAAVERARHGEASAREALTEARRRSAQFLARMSHEVRTVLSAATGIVDACLIPEGSTVRPDALQQIRSSVHSAADTLTRVIELSEYEDGTTRPYDEDFALTDLVDDAARHWSHLAQARGLQLTAVVEAGTPSRVISDCLRLRSVLFTLLANAIKYTDRGAVALVVRAVQDLLIVEVSDTGCGFPMSEAERLFDPFARALSARARAGDVGLGLSIARGIMHMLGGTLTARSAGPQRGATFQLRLPLRPSGTETCRQPWVFDAISRVEPTVEEPVGRLRGRRVLLVEDNPVNQKVARRLLDLIGLTVDTADDGQVALSRLNERRYDLILMDCSMPVLDGFEATRRLRERERTTGHHVPVVALTAHALPSTRRECRAAGMDDFLTKPLRKEVLVETLERWIGGQPGDGLAAS